MFFNIELVIRLGPSALFSSRVSRILTRSPSENDLWYTQDFVWRNIVSSGAKGGVVEFCFESCINYIENGILVMDKRIVNWESTDDGRRFWCQGPEHPKTPPITTFICHNFGQAMSKWLLGDVKLAKMAFWQCQTQYYEEPRSWDHTLLILGILATWLSLPGGLNRGTQSQNCGIKMMFMMKNKVCGGPNVAQKQPGCHLPENFKKVCLRSSCFCM